MKLKNTKKIKPTLSDKIADTLTLQSKPDIEDDHVFGTKPKTLSRADLSSSDSEDDAIISDFRKRNVNLLSDLNKKYEGSVVSRKNLDESESSESDDTNVNKPIQNQYNKKEQEDLSLESDFSDDLETENGQKGTAESSDDDSDVESDDYSIVKDATLSKKDDDDDDDDDEEEDDEEGYDVSQMEEPPQEEFEHVKKINVSEEAQKGAAVRNQLLLWEGLLEMRIHLQRCISTANQMPMKDVYDDLKKDNQFLEEAAATKGKVMDVLEKFLSLQQVLLQKYPETKAIASKSNSTETVKPQNQVDDNEEIPSDTDNEEIPSDTENEQSDNDSSDKKQTEPQVQNIRKRKLDDYEKDLAKTHKLFKTFRDTTIQKWNEKTRLATTANLKSAPTNTILQQISYILSDREKLIKRTQLKRSEYDIIGYSRPDDEKQQDTVDVSTDRKASDEYIPEIFDDSDFYHQLLRELIECKSADISDPVQLSRQWIALQQMRSKMKRKVDTKATKGRKIKYVVHNQLVNYMAPEKCLTWTEESANELYSSLFGKMFEQNNFAAQ